MPYVVIAVRARDRPESPNTAERTAMWLVNLGVFAFVAALVVSDSRHGALIMGVGLLLGVVAGVYHLTLARPDTR